MNQDDEKQSGDAVLDSSDLLDSNFITADKRNESEAACLPSPDTIGIPSSAYDKDGRLTFSGMLLTMEGCSFENWFSGRTPQMREWGKQLLARWREAGYPRLAEPPHNNCELNLLDFSLGMMAGVLLSNGQELSHSRPNKKAGKSGSDASQSKSAAAVGSSDLLGITDYFTSD